MGCSGLKYKIKELSSSLEEERLLFLLVLKEFCPEIQVKLPPGMVLVKRRVVSKNYNPKGERFLIASRFAAPPLACAFFTLRATVTPQDALTIIENKSKVHNSQSKPIASPVNACDINSSSEIAKLTHAVSQQTSAVTTAMTAMLKQLQSNPPPAQVKAVEEICVTCRGAYPYYQCLAAGGNTFPEFRDNIQGYVSAAAGNYNQGNTGYRPQGVANQMRPPGSGSLPGNTVANLKGELKAITTRSGLATDGPTIPTPPKFVNPEEDECAHPYYQCLAAGGNTFPKYQDNIQGYVSAVTGNFNQGNLGYRPQGVANQMCPPEEDECVEETYTDPDHTEYTIKVPPPPPVQKPKPPIQRNFVLHTKGISSTAYPALVLMPKYQKMLKALLSNKEKLQELANTPLNENCSAVILKKLKEKLGDPGKFLIPCGFSELKCKALADLGASINLMPLSVWKQLGLPDLIPNPDFVVVDYESDPRVLLILGRPFLRIARALIDIHGKEMILRDGDERLTLNMKHDTASYSNHPYRESVNLINIFNLSKVIPEFHDSKGCNFLSEELPDIDSFNDIHPHFDDDPLSGSTTYSANSLLEAFADELALITYPPDYDDYRECDIESDIREIEFLLFQEKSPQHALTIIEKKSKVRNSQIKPIASPVNACDNHSSSELAKLTHAVNQQTGAVTTAMTAMLKQFQSNPPPAHVKAVEEICVTCGGAHPYYQCLAAGGNTFLEYQDNIQGYVSAATGNYNQGNPGYRPQGVANQMCPPATQSNQNFHLNELEKIKRMNDVSLKAMQNQIDMVKNELRNEMKTSIQTSLSNQTNEIKNMMGSLLQMNIASTSGSGTLPGNTVANPKGELKAITTRSGLVTDGPTILNPPKSVNPEEDECVEETYTNPDHAEYTIKIPPPHPDCLENLVSNKQSGNPTFSLHKEIALPEVIHEIHDSKGCTFLSEELPDIDSFNDIHPHFDDDPLSGSTTFLANSLLEEFTDELALITYPPDYDDNRTYDIESDIREIEFLLYQEIESDATFDDDLFDSEGEKIKEAELLIDQLDLPCDILSDIPGFMKILANGFHYLKSSLSPLFNLGIT
nr:reverse transcriptase domain-containing protein [Tanacetum cinerariifolium]